MILARLKWNTKLVEVDEFVTKFKRKYKNNDFYFVKNNDEVNDFNLFRFAKNFAVGPSTFHWWGAWLNTNENKMCLYPANLNPSNNVDFWPKEWTPL